jgi:ABC-2 type transport system ATP-binding protein
VIRASLPELAQPILGLIEPTNGEDEVLGQSIKDPSAYLHRVGALIEAPAFYPA